MRNKLFAVLLVSLAAVAFAADASDPHIARVESGLLPPARIAGRPPVVWTIAERMKLYKVPGVSIAILDGHALAWARGYGVARVGGDAPVTPDTLFQAASISKPVTAVAALTLVDSGRLSLDADVNEKLKSWKVPASALPTAAGESVTLRRLLSHTAGLTVHGFAGYAVGEPRPSLVQILDGTKPANSIPIRIDQRPGTLWRYSGGGYCIAQQLMLDVTGENFPALLRDRVLRPAGMDASTFEQPLPAALAAHATAGHTNDGQPIAGDAHIYPEMAAAGLWTTPSDLARFALALQRSLDGKGGLLSRELAAEMTKPALPNSGYGLGIGIVDTGENLQLAHNGGNEGFRCALVFYPRTGRGAIVMTNSDNGGPLINEILRAVAAEYAWPHYRVVEKQAVPLAPEAFDHFVGRYQHEDALAAIFRDGDHFYFQIRGQVRREIFPSSDHEFFLLNAPEVLSFERDDTGRATFFTRSTQPPQIFQRAR